MSDAASKLLDYAVEFVTPADVAKFVPSDPGYPEYVKAWHAILASREVPRELTFAVSETIGLTRWADAKRESDPERFRRFRVLTSVVALCIELASEFAVDDLPSNYSVVSLLDDAVAFQDQVLVRLSRPVLDEVHRSLSDKGSEEGPFALLGLLLADAKLGASEADLSAQADRLIEQEKQFAGRASADFLFGCSHFDQLTAKWVSLVRLLVPPATPCLKLVRDAILSRSTADA